MATVEIIAKWDVDTSETPTWESISGLDYTIADGDLGITREEAEDVYGTAMYIYRAVTDSELNLNEGASSDYVSIGFESDETYNLTVRFGSSGVPEQPTNEDTEEWLDSAFDVCYAAGMEALASRLLQAPPPTSYSYKKVFTTPFESSEIENIRPQLRSAYSIATTSTSESEAY